MTDEKLGRFDHHPNPAIDFEIEVEELENDWLNHLTEFEPLPKNFEDRLRKAMSFIVGAHPSCVKAKNILRRVVNQHGERRNRMAVEIQNIQETHGCRARRDERGEFVIHLGSSTTFVSLHTVEHALGGRQVVIMIGEDGVMMSEDAARRLFTGLQNALRPTGKPSNS